MASFNRLVLFKEQEAFFEFQKTKFDRQNFIADNYSNEENLKGLIMVKFEPKEGMKVEFINKVGCDIIEYERNQAIGLRITELMP